MQDVLLIGFGPFLSYSFNQSGDIAKRLNSKIIDGFNIRGFEIKVEHRYAYDRAKELISSIKPSIVIGMGLAATKGSITIERVAINYFYFVDSNGDVIEEKINKNGKDAYFTSLPFNEIRSAIENEGIPAEFSFYADTYLSNELFYAIMEAAEENSIRYAGFIHLPLIHKQVIDRKNIHYFTRSNIPSLSYEEELKTIEVTIKECIKAFNANR
ncbi:MAG: pyrrolidone-carboxylate peptidase [Candidatus Micrarchaeota archaeon]|nr:MAG: pyrrolidone-carboxylate peptidase [Candidatus Micrarchaeota archaeon]